MQQIRFYQTAITFAGTLLILFIFVTVARSQDDYQPSVKGYVTDGASGKPLPGVSIIINPSGATVLTDSNGYYIVRNLPLGRYSIEFSCVGYESKLLPDVLVSSGKETERNVPL